ncbi:MAG: Conserved carboxylase region [Clostridiales bacterium 38_11]|nr:MAG: Conserved carboxylase region [Clostridiales bacterium 38_11]HBH12353.1 oxaloacetate decarboxylase subunit alpha [Clostridiales bacterium]
MKPVKITETSLRDGHQSLIATRMTTEEMIPILGKMDQVGYHAIEVWGGATFDSCLRFLNEDPWERLRTIRKQIKNTKLQMLLRGQNLVGYRHYADDTVEEFVKKAIKNGIDIVRVFDALNDPRNMKKSIDVIKAEGAHCQCAISYATSIIHKTEYYVNLIKELELMGADSICIKDMSGILKPYDAYQFIKEIKKVSDLPIELHNHCTSGVASMTMLKAIEAGVDIVDTAISPFSSGTSQPPTETIVEALRDTEYETGLDILVLDQIADHFKVIRDRYLADGILSSKVLFVEPRTLLYQVPGGMLSNLVSQLKSLNAENKFEEVLREIPKVREDLGFPPLVTPLSQMVGTQAVFNVITGSRYKMVPNEIKRYVKGFYGKSPGPISDDIRKLIIGDGEVITVRPADLLENELEKAKAEIPDLYESMEDVLSYVLFPQIAKEFLEYRKFNSYEKAEGYIG